MIQPIIEKITPLSAEKICRKILIDLPEYFGLLEANEHYLKMMPSLVSFAARVDEDYVGLLSLHFPYPSTCNIYWMGILRAHQRRGIGNSLIEYAELFAKTQGAKTITVETLSPTEEDENYLKTYKFYEKKGFSPLFQLQPTGYIWNMVYMSKHLENGMASLIAIEKDARDFGFEWPHKEMIIDQALSECDEIKEAILHNETDTRIQEEMGDLLHTAISLCLFSGYDIEETLLKVTQKFSLRMHALKEITKARGLYSLHGKTIEFMVELWKEAKLKMT